ncbi:MAG: dihydrofolate reductase [Treponemataceae bacterium]
MKITAILSATEDGGIGYNGNLLYRISADLKRFKEITSNNIVIMGYKTFESLNLKPLPNRVNIVLTRKTGMPTAENLFFCSTLEQTLILAKNYPQKEIFIIGGQSVYEQFLPHCTDVLLTRIHTKTPADAFFFPLDEKWSLSEQSQKQTENNVDFTYEHWKRNL